MKSDTSAARAEPRGEAQRAREPRGEAQRARSIGKALLLAVCLAAVFGRSLAGDFVYDDLRLVGRNPRVTGVEPLWPSLAASHWGFDDPLAEGSVGYWRPLTVLALRAAYALGGGAPLGFHALSLALHFLAALAAWRLARLLLGDGRAAFAAALLFALHPVHVESVAWISAVNDPLFGLLALVSLGAFVSWRQRGSPGVPFGAALAFLLALLAKEQAIAVLPLALALDLARHLTRRAGDEPPPAKGAHARGYAACGAAFTLYYVLRVLVFGDALAGFDRTNVTFAMGWARALSFRAEVLGGLLWIGVVPLELALFRPFRPELPPLDPAFHGALAVLAAWAAATLLAVRERAPRATALLLFAPLALLPVVLSVDATGEFPFSDRYFYLSALAVAAGLAALAFRCLPARAAWAAVAALALAYGARSWTRVEVWRDEGTLFRAAARESPRSPFVQWGLGRVLLGEYRASGERALLYEALVRFLTSSMLGEDYGERAPRLGAGAPLHARASELMEIVDTTPPEARSPDPTVWVTAHDRLQANLGRAWCFLFLAEISAQPDRDLPYLIFQRQTQVFPASFEAWTGLGAAHAARGETAEAVAAFEKALECNPRYAEAWNALGLARVAEGEWDAARDAFAKALELRPGHVPYMLDAARSAIEGGRLELAEDWLARAEAAAPDSLQPLYVRALLCAQRGEFARALALLDRVLARQKDHGLAHLQRAKLQLLLGSRSEAVRSFARACELLPESFEAHYNLGALLLDERPAAALPYLVRAYEASPPGERRAAVHAALATIASEDLASVRRLAEIAEREGEWAHAAEWLAALARLEPGLANHRYRLGVALRQCGRPVEASARFEECLALAPDHFEARHDLGLLLAGDEERAAEASAHLERALELLDGIAGMDPQRREAVRRRLQGALGVVRGQGG